MATFSHTLPPSLLPATAAHIVPETLFCLWQGGHVVSRDKAHPSAGLSREVGDLAPQVMV